MIETDDDIVLATTHLRHVRLRRVVRARGNVYVLCRVRAFTAART